MQAVFEETYLEAIIIFATPVQKLLTFLVLVSMFFNTETNTKLTLHLVITGLIVNKCNDKSGEKRFLCFSHTEENWCRNSFHSTVSNIGLNTK